MNEYVLKLYITRRTPRSEHAITILRRIWDQEMGRAYKLIVGDALEKLKLGENDRIIATRTLIKELPEPVRQVISGLANTEKVLLGLSILTCNTWEEKVA